MYEIHDFNHLNDTFRLSQCVEDKTLAYKIFKHLDTNGFQVRLIDASINQTIKESRRERKPE